MIRLRQRLFDANTPEYTVTCRLGGGTKAAMRESRAWGARPMLRVPTDQGRLNSTVTFPSASRCSRSWAKGPWPTGAARCTGTAFPSHACRSVRRGGREIGQISKPDTQLTIKCLTLQAIRLESPDGMQSILFTNLIDKKRYSAARVLHGHGAALGQAEVLAGGRKAGGAGLGCRNLKPFRFD